jgi:RimJ/RimL family protein N-acetyltransferase
MRLASPFAFVAYPQHIVAELPEWAYKISASQSVAEKISAYPCRLNLMNTISSLPHEIRTERLLLRRWRDADRAPFAAMNADPRVMEHFPALLSPHESDARVEHICAHFDRHGYGAWAVEIPGVTHFAGFVGLTVPQFEAHFTPAVEIGWRLAAEHWGRGYATEGARAALDFGFTHLKLAEIVSFTVPANTRSRRVMEKLGMTHDPREDFDHPNVADGHPLKRHVLYRIRR